MLYRSNAGGTHYVFDDLRQLLARASPDRAGDRLAGLAAESGEERVAARMALADLPLARFLDEAVVPYEMDEVTRLVLDTHDKQAFAPIAAMTAGDFRDFLLSDEATGESLAHLAPGITPEMAAAVSKLMRNQDLIAVAKKIRGRQAVPADCKPSRLAVAETRRFHESSVDPGFDDCFDFTAGGCGPVAACRFRG